MEINNLLLDMTSELAYTPIEATTIDEISLNFNELIEDLLAADDLGEELDMISEQKNLSSSGNIDEKNEDVVDFYGLTLAASGNGLPEFLTPIKQADTLETIENIPQLTVNETTLTVENNDEENYLPHQTEEVDQQIALTSIEVPEINKKTMTASAQPETQINPGLVDLSQLKFTQTLDVDYSNHTPEQSPLLPMEQDDITQEKMINMTKDSVDTGYAISFEQNQEANEAPQVDLQHLKLNLPPVQTTSFDMMSNSRDATTTIDSPEEPIPVFNTQNLNFQLPQTNIPQEINTQIELPVGHEEWDNQVAEKIHWLSNQEVKSAQIHLNPPELGPLSAHIKMLDKGAEIVIASQHAETREAMEQALPRLKELFTENGMTLANVDISDFSQQQGEKHQQSEQPTRPWIDFNDQDSGITTPIGSKKPQSAVDYYA